MTDWKELERVLYVRKQQLHECLAVLSNDPVHERRRLEASVEMRLIDARLYHLNEAQCCTDRLRKLDPHRLDDE